MPAAPAPRRPTVGVGCNPELDGHSHCDAFHERVRCVYGFAVLTKALDVKFNRSTNELHRLISRFPDRDATWKVWDVRSDR